MPECPGAASSRLGEVWLLDIYALLDQLEQLAHGTRRFRFTNKIMIDEDELLDLIDQLRTAIPDEVRQAKRMLSERERILATAQSEAERLVQQAEQDAGKLIDNEKLVAEAKEQADRILQEATETAEQVRSGADQYAADVLRSLEELLSGQLGRVRNGLQQLEGEQRA